MLSYLSIKNVVLIEALTLEFQNGFCALTGETGAGKSILLDSLGLALGARSDVGLIRKGCDQASVSACFDLSSDHAIFELLKDQDIEAEDGELVLRRVLTQDGRSRAFINDQPVSVSLLKNAGQLLVEIHGQFDTHGLINPKTHLGLLDDFADVDVLKIQKAWQALRDVRARIDEERNRADQAHEHEEYLRQSLEDLDSLDIKEGEEEKLVSLKQRLSNREQVLEALQQAYHCLTAEEGSESSIGKAYRAIDRVVDKFAGQADTIIDALDRASSEVQEAVSLIQSLSADMDASEYSLEEIDDRLYALRGQARKHSCTVDELPQVRDKIAQDISSIENQDEILAQLLKEAEQAKSAYEELAKKISQQRTKAAEKLDSAIMKELEPLKLDKARFVTQVKTLNEDSWTSKGMDDVCFLVSTNPGRDPGPLNKIASGGEMARFMLALKVVLAQSGGPSSLIFDEVDTGIGGSTAAAVGDRLLRLSKSKQILVVTHSPQVAACAGHHFIVMKDGGDDIRTAVITLEKHDDRREEIARMLAGETITDESRAAADKLLETGT